MDGHEHPRVSDDALEREIEAALGVEPSRDFLPRVRARIASERIGVSGWDWFHSWRWASGAAAVMAAAILGLWMLDKPRLEVRTPEPERRATNFEPQVESSVMRIPEHEPRIPKPVIRAARQTRRPAVVQPEVVISPEEAGALRQLFAAIGNRRLETALLPDFDAALEPPSEIEAIVLEPLTVSPLASLEGE
jgi:hypothetical protein